MELDELLTRSGAVSPPAADLVNRLTATVQEAARADIARRAVLVRRRRLAKFGSGLVGAGAAAAVVAVVALQPASTGTPGGGQQTKPQPTLTQAPDFKTVAQVVNAAALATPNLDPAAAPYWKVVLRQYVQGCSATPEVTSPNSFHTSCSMQRSTYTIWNGLGRPGVVETVGGGGFAPIGIPAATLTLAGRTMTWAEANSRHWSTAELASLVADDAAPGKPGRPRAEWYIFKNTADLLTTSPAGSELRKQLWHYLATVQGAQLDGQAKDALGRTGWEISYTLAGYGTQTFLIDAVTGQLLETREVLPGQPEPSIGTLVAAGPSDTAPAPAPSTDLRMPKGHGPALKPMPGTSPVPQGLNPQS